MYSYYRLKSNSYLLLWMTTCLLRPAILEHQKTMNEGFYDNVFGLFSYTWAFSQNTYSETKSKVFTVDGWVYLFVALKPLEENSVTLGILSALSDLLSVGSSPR